MRLHSVIVSYKRPELTVRAFESYLKTVSLPWTLIVVDNGSGAEVERILSRMTADVPGAGVMLLGENVYPGRATNLGWEQAPKAATHFHRADNDFVFLPGWCDEVERMFRTNQLLGQLGLRTNEEELDAIWNVGGNCVIDRRVFDKGVRYQEQPWPDYPPGYTEDSFYSGAIREAGWDWDRVERPCILSTSRESAEDPYYRETWAARRINGFGEDV